ncbi:MAG: zinc ribbon domain-containing protein [Candidatus Bathyarchaeia archaeon]
MPRIAPSLLFALVLLAVAVLSLGSLAYPLVTVPILRTDTLANTTASNYVYWSTVSSTSAGWVPYSTSTGLSIVYNYSCDPASMACYPTQTYSITQTLSTFEAHTQISQVTLTTQSVATGQVEVTHTDFGMTPAYAASGLSDSLFFSLAAIVMLVLVLVVMVTFVKTRGTTEPPQVKPRRESFCINCGAKLRPGSRFCGECGSKQT